MDMQIAVEPVRRKMVILSKFAVKGSKIGSAILNDWNIESENFIKVFPKDYKRALERMKEADALRIAKEKQETLKDTEVVDSNFILHLFCVFVSHSNKGLF
ncbi:hypothetical protein WUBG_17455 [Wuchereria bancrofti]|uniref:Uncharacterized protein n=1 Tax=Wuchereria bancrofti TaxID=6293 RepID=J9DPS7_WUCBA|nr:hypothetical protein WUBG_17455 [Wuchereria bancrofti]